MKKRLQGIKVWGIRFLFAVAVIAVYKTFDNFNEILRNISSLFSVLTPFLIGIVIAFFLYLPTQKLETLFCKTKRNFILSHARVFSILTVYLAFFAVIAVLLILVIPTLYQSGRDFLVRIPGYITVVTDFLEENVQSLGELPLVDDFLDQLTMSNILNWLNLNNMDTYAKFVQDLVSRLIDFFLGVAVSVYILIDRKQIISGIRKLSSLIIKTQTVEKAIHFFSRVCRVLYSFFYGQVLDALIVGVACAIGLQVIGIPNALVLGLVYGLFSLIPYFGAFIGFVIVGIFTFLSVGFGKFLIVLIFIVVLQQIDGNIINPKITGDSLGIRPLWVIFGVTVGGGLFGLSGLLLGPPVMAIVREILVDLVDHRRLGKKDHRKDPPSEEGEDGVDGDLFNEEKMEIP